MGDDSGPDDDGEEYMQQHSIAVIGFGGVGKTAMTVKFVNNDQTIFNEEWDPTVEDNYTVQRNLDGKPVKVNVIDTAGQDELKDRRETYMSASEGFMLVYAVDDRTSFEKLGELIKQIREVKRREIFPCIVVENKSDLESKRVVRRAEGEQLSVQLRAPFRSVSAKRGDGVLDCFRLLIAQCKSFEVPSKSGYLVKRGGGSSIFGRKSWLKRWFELTDHSLVYRKDKGAEGILGSLELSQIRSVIIKEDMDFTVASPHRVYHMRAASLQERDEWVSVLRSSAHIDQ